MGWGYFNITPTIFAAWVVTCMFMFFPPTFIFVLSIWYTSAKMSITSGCILYSFITCIQCCRSAETRYQNGQLRHKTDMTSSTEIFRNEGFYKNTKFYMNIKKVYTLQWFNILFASFFWNKRYTLPRFFYFLDNDMQTTTEILILHRLSQTNQVCVWSFWVFTQNFTSLLI